MFDLEKAITDWRGKLAASGIRSTDALGELEAHLRELIGQLSGGALTDAERFQIATQRIGSIPLIKKEFEKLTRSRFRRRLGELSQVDYLGIGFMIMGLSGLTFLPPLWLLGFSPIGLRGIICVTLCVIQAGIGVGLMRRLEWARVSALVWAFLFFAVNLTTLRLFAGLEQHFIFYNLRVPFSLDATLSNASRWQVLLATRSADFRHVANAFEPVFLGWGIWLLTRRKVRSKFDDSPKIQAA